MKASQFSDAQKAFVLKQGSDGMPVADICRKAGISQATYFNWKKKYDGLLPTEMRRLKQLQDENSGLRQHSLGSFGVTIKKAPPFGSGAEGIDRAIPEGGRGPGR